MRDRLILAALAIVALACVPALVAWRPGTWPELPLREPVFRCLLWIFALCVLGIAARLTAAGRRRLAGGFYVAIAAISVAAYTNFGHFHFPHVVHHWEQFHYQLGSKYFPELGFDGLYVASLAAQQERFPHIAPQPRMRDLRNNNERDTGDLAAHAAEVKSRFTPERWRRFVADNGYFVRTIPPGDLARIRTDHGYNPSPAWTFVARLFNAGPLDGRRLALLAGLDAVLMAVAFGCIFWTFGLRAGCMSLVIFGLGWAGRFAFVGGAYLRFDWLAATAIAICLVKRERPAAAGALLGYAAAVRLFPAVLLFGPAVQAVGALRRGRRPNREIRLFAGFATALAFAVAAGGLTGHGLGAWSEFAERMQLYRVTIARNAVGLESVVLYGPEILAHAFTDPRDTVGFQIEREDWTERRGERILLFRAAQALLLALLAAAVWRATPVDAVVLGIAGLFALTHAANYYWAILLVVPLRRNGAGTWGVLGVSFAMYAVALAFANSIVWHGLFSWALLLLFVAWLLPAAAGSLPKDAEPDPGADPV